MATSPKIYVDTCCFIDAVKFDLNLPIAADTESERNRRSDCWFFKKLCDAALSGAVTLVTSILTIAECTHVGSGGAPDEATQDKIIHLLSSGRVVDLVEADIFIAEQARDLRWKHNINLSGADSLHFATAVDQGCVEFLTTDARISAQNHKVVRAIPQFEVLGLKIIRSSNALLLPNEFRTGDFFDDAPHAPH